MGNRSYLLLCCLAAFMALESKETVRLEMPFMVPNLDNVPMADAETIKFIHIYTGHGYQFDPQLR